MKNKAIVSIGSNRDRTKNIKEVVEVLSGKFPGSRFSTPEITDPIDLPESAKQFLNLVAVIYTELEVDAFKAILKKIEKKMGRNPDDDEEGVVPIDLDLIEWNDEVYKPQDLVRPYVVAGMDELDEF
ncbi:MAG: 2-amino-4-hydroxy-6-hydroxymethyldihydropteridine diphosphokinase [Porphyromonas sp.]|nr:2-amino-4-hydroxy-6-hydroxymethyldihydropteridine diphosphokinase [Porphyromonas sp.]